MRSRDDSTSKVKELIQGKFCHHYVNYGTGWSFEFDNGLWLSVQEIEFPEETVINKALIKVIPTLYDLPNSEDMAKALMVARIRGYSISAINIIEKSELRIHFENNIEMLVKTDTSIVDWHWSISKANTDPYTETIVACYDPSDYEFKANK